MSRIMKRRRMRIYLSFPPTQTLWLALQRDLSLSSSSSPCMSSTTSPCWSVLEGAIQRPRIICRREIIYKNYLWEFFANKNYLQKLFLRIFAGGDQAGKALPGKDQPGHQNSTQGCTCITSLVILITKVGDLFFVISIYTCLFCLSRSSVILNVC